MPIRSWRRHCCRTAAPAPITPDQIRLAAKSALAQIDPALAKLPKDHPLAAIAADLHRC